MGRKINAFTLVELIIVLAIIAILATIVIAYFRTQIFKGNDARRKADLNRIQVALEEYEKDKNCYPLTLPACDPGTGLKPYLEKIPCDPASHADYFYEHEDALCPDWYRLYTKLDNVADPMAMPLCGGPLNNSFNYYVSSPNGPACIGSGSGTGAGSGTGTGTGTGTGSSPAPSTGPGGTQYYGCKGGVCAPIGWDYSRPGGGGPECRPNFQNSNCYSQCGPPSNECDPY